MKKWIWRDIELCMPASWEMLQFSRDRERGRCAFADRYQFRLELDWSEVEREPDMQRLISDYKSKLEKDDGIEDGKLIRIAGHHGLMGHDSRCRFSRFGIWLADGGCLVELVFLWPDERDKEIERQVLESVHYRNVDRENDRVWRAFDMEAHVPADYIPSSFTVKPAMVELRFEGPDKPERMRFMRLGMLESWMEAPLRDWLPAQTDHFVFDKVAEERSFGQMKGAVLRGTYRPKGVLHRNGEYLSACWVDPADGRLYMIENISRRGKSPPLNELMSKLHSAAK